MVQSHDQQYYSFGRSLADEIRDSHLALSDLWQGVTSFAAYKKCVTVYGSARFTEDHPYYILARQTAKALAEGGFQVMTGGGPGIMEAANRGAKEGGGVSLGCNIRLPFEQKLNPYVDVKVEFEFFFTRKVILRKNSVAYVLMPGGLGTMDEIFEVLTLLQTGKLPYRPVVCMGTEYWHHMQEFLRKTMLASKTISEEDLNLAFLTDKPQEAVSYIIHTLAKNPSVKEDLPDIY
jgi:uncharacterized protein (TIGR00730 family)